MANIKIKIGTLEFACEGEEDFLKTEVPNFLKTVGEFYQQIPRDTTPTTPIIPKLNGNGHQEPLEMSVNNIATKLNASSGAELTLASCASLTLVKRMTTFSRQQILDEMKDATNFYKESFSANLSAQLTRLVENGKLIERSTGQYALAAQTKTEMETRLLVTA
jgi:flagellar hook assembly protein FlgD